MTELWIKLAPRRFGKNLGLGGIVQAQQSGQQAKAFVDRLAGQVLPRLYGRNGTVPKAFVRINQAIQIKLAGCTKTHASTAPALRTVEAEELGAGRREADTTAATGILA